MKRSVSPRWLETALAAHFSCVSRSSARGKPSLTETPRRGHWLVWQSLLGMVSGRHENLRSPVSESRSQRRPFSWRAARRRRTKTKRFRVATAWPVASARAALKREEPFLEPAAGQAGRPKGVDARFGDLRAYGAFLVS